MTHFLEVKKQPSSRTEEMQQKLSRTLHSPQKKMNRKSLDENAAPRRSRRFAEIELQNATKKEDWVKRLPQPGFQFVIRNDYKTSATKIYRTEGLKKRNTLRYALRQGEEYEKI